MSWHVFTNYRAIFVVASLVFGGCCVWPSLRGLVYIRIRFPRYKRRLNRSPLHATKVGVFVPCKGGGARLETHLEMICTQEDVPSYTVTFITESEEDSACAAIRKVVARHPHARHVVAGLAERCGQKNHNLLMGVRDNSESDVFVFCDADGHLDRKWLGRLIEPMVRDDVAVVTGFCRVIPRQRTISGTLHAMMVGYQGMAISNNRIRPVWGGGMAIRRDLFEAWDVEGLWERTVVDDMTLTALVRKYRVRRVYNPTCIMQLDEIAESVREAVDWFLRQILFVKFYLRRLWIQALLSYAGVSAWMAMSSVLVARSLVRWDIDSWLWMSGAFLLVVTSWYASLKYFCRNSQSVLRWFLLSPLTHGLWGYVLLKTLFTRRIRWRNVEYRLDRRGRVVEVCRDANT